MKKIEIPIVIVCYLEEVDVISTSGGEGININSLEEDIDYRQGNSRGPWGNGPWDN